MNDQLNSGVSPPKWDDKFSILILRFFDDDLSTAEFDEFVDLLKCHPHLRAQYVDVALQENTIREGTGLRPSVPQIDLVSPALASHAKPISPNSLDLTASPPATGSRLLQQSMIGIPILALAAALLFGAWAWINQPESIAKISQAIGSDPYQQTEQHDNGELFAGEIISFATGAVEVDFAGGANIILTGPAKIRLDSADHATLFLGGLFATVNEQSIGFTVETATAKVVDLGTQFTMHVDENETTSVKVNSGSVDVYSATSQSRVGEGEALAVGPQGQLNRIEPTGKAFSHILESLENPNYSITTDRDTFVIGGQWADQSMHQLAQEDDRDRVTNQHDLLVKREIVVKQFNRIGVIGFDLSHVPRERLLGARLKLSTAPNNLAKEKSKEHVKRMRHRPEPKSPTKWRFAVLGVWDQGLGRWREKTLTWNNAPGIDSNSSTGELIGPDSPMEVGTFDLIGPPTNQQEISIAGKDLLDFLQADADGKVTFLVRRVTGNINDRSVHGFASREHPSLEPPTLELWLNN